ncbi:MAG: transposase [Methylotetracoccus sp.]|nr:transposase [Methylotetracoccus sp.]
MRAGCLILLCQIEAAQAFRSKGEIALDMVMRLRREGLHFSFAAFDGGYGHLPWLRGELDGEGETFFAEAHSDQAIYLQDPAPVVLARRSPKGRVDRRQRTAIIDRHRRRRHAMESAYRKQAAML